MKNRFGRIRWVAALAAVMAACGEEGPTTPQTVEDATFAASLGINLAQMTRLPSGVYIQTLTAGTGTATVAASNTVVLDYTLWLPDGTRVDGPARLNPANAGNGFIPGFSQGLIGLKVSEVRRIIVPSELGYGGSPPDARIPKHSVLVFEIKLISMS